MNPIVVPDPSKANPMKATQFEFRFRFLILVFLYALGFWAPWTWTAGNYAPPKGTAWLALSTRLGQPLGVQNATLLVTWLAILCAALGAWMRLWGSAYLGPSIVHAAPMQAGRVTASGPYRYVRNPLYIGAWLFAVAVAILMSPSGAVVFLVLMSVFYFRLILGEETFLASRLGTPYVEYTHQVPRLRPTLQPRIPASPSHPAWLQSAAAEIMPIGYALSLAVLAWRYDPWLLIRCLLVCLGLSLVTRALLPGDQAPAAP